MGTFYEKETNLESFLTLPPFFKPSKNRLFIFERLGRPELYIKMSQLVMDHSALIVGCKTVFELVLSETAEFYLDDEEDVEVSYNKLLINVLTIIGKNCM
jgi:hypothetical protein